jgi:hypothetical protein
MTKRQIIDRVLRLNPTAAPEFLAQFHERDLLDYLRHLAEVEFENRQKEPLPSEELELAAV